MVKISSAFERGIINDLEYILSLKANDLNLFFTDIDYIKRKFKIIRNFKQIIKIISKIYSSFMGIFLLFCQ